MRIEAWQHEKSGERIIVTVKDSGGILAAVGPLHYSDIEECFRNGYDSDHELVDDLCDEAFVAQWIVVRSEEVTGA